MLPLFVPAAGFAAEDVPPPPPMEEGDPDAPLPEAKVTVIHKGETTIEEYRVRGQLRYAKITPKKGKPYYMFDSDGDGMLDSRHNDLDNPPINQWILFRW